jgi:hypothetical protein
MPSLAEDYELWVRMMLCGFRRFYNLPDVLLDYRGPGDRGAPQLSAGIQSWHADPVEGPHAVPSSLLAHRPMQEGEPTTGHSLCSQG